MNRRAETLLETVVAISMIMVILAPASSVFLSSGQNTSGNRGDLQASMFAMQGLELVRKIRNTNFYRFPKEAVQYCWNVRYDVAPGAIPDNTDFAAYCANNGIAAGSYVISHSPEHPSGIIFNKIHDLPDGMALENPSSDYRLKLDKSTAPVCDPVNPASGCHIHFRDDTHLHTATRGVPVDFYREVKIEYSGAERMKVTSTVVYRAGSEWKSVKSSTALSRIP